VTNNKKKKPRILVCSGAGKYRSNSLHKKMKNSIKVRNQIVASKCSLSSLIDRNIVNIISVVIITIISVTISMGVSSEGIPVVICRMYLAIMM
jgi:hypothetical protein